MQLQASNSRTESCKTFSSVLQDFHPTGCKLYPVFNYKSLFFVSLCQWKPLATQLSLFKLYQTQEGGSKLVRGYQLHCCHWYCSFPVLNHPPPTQMSSLFCPLPIKLLTLQNMDRPDHTLWHVKFCNNKRTLSCWNAGHTQPKTAFLLGSHREGAKTYL